MWKGRRETGDEIRKEGRETREGIAQEVVIWYSNRQACVRLFSFFLSPLSFPSLSLSFCKETLRLLKIQDTNET